MLKIVKNSANPAGVISIAEVVTRARTEDVFILAKRLVSVPDKATRYQVVFVGAKNGVNKYLALNLGHHKVFDKTPMPLDSLLNKLIDKGMDVRLYESNDERHRAANSRS